MKRPSLVLIAAVLLLGNPTPAQEASVPAPTPAPAQDAPAVPAAVAEVPATADPATPDRAPVVEAAAPVVKPAAPVVDPEVAAAQRGTTGICGRLVDDRTGEVLIEAPVAVVKGGSGEVRTDIDGNFTLPLAPGLYDLRARYELYQARRVNGIAVVAGECTRISIKLAQQDAGVEEVVVTARKDTRREAAVMVQRQLSPVVQDAMSAQEISRTPDGVASDAVKRVVSATVVDGKYVYLRGLGGRYSSVLLNGVPLPSPDADENAVPLDLFPTALLASLNVVKTYQPELPGSFAGGTLQIETNPYPQRFQAQLSVSGWGSSTATGAKRRSYEGGGYDFLGYDDGSRALPGSVPTSGPLAAPDVDAAGRAAATRGFQNQWTTTERTALPGLGVGGSVGDTLDVGGRKLGYLALFDYGVKETARRSVVRAEAQYSSVEPLQFRDQYRVDQGVLAADLSGLVSLGLEAGPDHDLSLLVLYTHTGESKAQRAIGTSLDGNASQADRLQFVERGMTFGQLRGEHRFAGLGELDLTWHADVARVTRDEPDTRDVLYFAEGNAPLSWASRLAGSGDRFYSEVRDNTASAGLDLGMPFGSAQLKVGASGQHTGRTFLARRFRFREPPADGGLLTLPPDQLFAPGNINDQFHMTEITSGSDAYDATQVVTAAYLAADLALGPVVRLSGGVRVEQARVELKPGSAFAVTAAPAGVDRSDLALLPGVNLVWRLAEDANLRAAWSHTMVRPQFRELAPFVFVDFDRKRTVEGNPALEVTRIQNLDLRWEKFPGESEVVAASVFYKDFADPIETVIQTATGGQVKFENAPGAKVYGVELEGRLALRRLGSAVRQFHAAANVALVRSEVELGAETRQTSKSRPLQGQSPVVLNASLTWANEGLEATLLYNVYGKRITEVGIEGLPDGYEQPFHRIDFTLSHVWRELKAKVALTNLLDSRVVIEQGGIEVLGYRPGVTGSVSLEWTHQ